MIEGTDEEHYQLNIFMKGSYQDNFYFDAKALSVMTHSMMSVI